jgi:hypothetical protein
MSLLENAKHLDDVNSGDYKAIYYLGGRGPVIDLPDYGPNIRLAEEVRTTSCQRTLSSYTSSSFTARESLLLPSAMALRK